MLGQQPRVERMGGEAPRLGQLAIEVEKRRDIGALRARLDRLGEVRMVADRGSGAAAHEIVGPGLHPVDETFYRSPVDRRSELRHIGTAGASELGEEALAEFRLVG